VVVLLTSRFRALAIMIVWRRCSHLRRRALRLAAAGETWNASSIVG
jgi:hypothetical protein